MADIGLPLLRKSNIRFHFWNASSHHTMEVHIGDPWTGLRFLLFHMREKAFPYVYDVPNTKFRVNLRNSENWDDGKA
jgi:hypothetical protein